jgi:hypothetical protein
MIGSSAQHRRLHPQKQPRGPNPLALFGIGLEIRQAALRRDLPGQRRFVAARIADDEDSRHLPPPIAESGLLLNQNAADRV